ncbi:MAG: hypothetical protein Q7S64_02290 [bacterium]|nr:hypothetical protein [bacterium]
MAPVARKTRTKRLAYLPCAIDLIEHSRNVPTMKVNPNKKTELLYRFGGLTKEKEVFYVQIKENVKTGAKYLMSIFPPE